MLLGQVVTLDDAKAFIREREQIEREDLHMLTMHFPEATALLLDLVQAEGIELIGPHGR